MQTNITTSKCNGCKNNCRLVITYSPSMQKYVPTINGELALFYQDEFNKTHNIQAYTKIQGTINAARHIAQEYAKHYTRTR